VRRAFLLSLALAFAAAAPASAAPNYFGFNGVLPITQQNNLAPHPDDPTAEQVRDAVRNVRDPLALRGNTYRLPMGWKFVQPNGPNSWSWQYYDTLIPILAAGGIHPILTLQLAPGWARRDECSSNILCPPKVQYYNEFATFAAAVAAKYPQAAAVEVWNEPDLSKFWPTTNGPSGKAYARMYNPVSTAINGANPNIRILFGSLAHTKLNNDNGNPWWKDFLQDFYEEAQRPTLDEGPGYLENMAALSYHPYNEAFDDTDGTSDGELINLVQNHDPRPSRPFWATEFGYSAGTRDISTGAISGFDDAAQKASIFAQLGRLENDTRVKAVLIHTLFEEQDLTGSNNGTIHAVIAERYPANSDGRFSYDGLATYCSLEIAPLAFVHC
jgi:Cellulase (glycosyl hydrolase family 5)